MLIDWFTVVAQLINFVILLVILKFVLYDRVVDAMQKRQQRIEDELEEAEQKQEEADRRAEEAQAEKRRLDEERDEILGDARREAEERRRDLIDEARREADEQERRWRAALADERERLLEELQIQTGVQAVAVSRRALADLADDELEGRIVRSLTRRLDDLDEDEREEVVGALREAEGPLRIATAFELGDERRRELRAAIGGLAEEAGSDIEWDHDESVSAGVRITAGARTIAWSIEDYLDDVSQRFSRTIRRYAPSDRESDDEPDERR